MTTPNQQNPADAMLSFWKDAWARMGVGAAPAGAPVGTGPAASPFPGASGADPMAWMPSPEMVRRMQAAFLDAMASSAEQYMRSPQFLESVRHSIESATEMRRQMEELVRRNMGDAMKPPGQAGAEVLAALTEIESRLSARLDQLEALLRSRGAGSGQGRPADSAGSDAATAPDGAPRPRRTGRGRDA
ncbi:MAG TPA: hypothetical protein PKC43_09700 [Phycisphaerales bacterium]|nr:hypothetical protein [Phycisphaerales bacterium]HMP37708.1 hypothetical protein [Phycisphaerales bacterium]